MEENYQPVEQPVEQPVRKSGGNEDKIFAALGYISILFVVPLILKHDVEEVYFHAKQGMVLFLAEVVVWFVLFMLESFIVALLPRMDFSITAWLGAIAWIVFVTLSIVGIYHALRGRKWMMPILGKIAQSVEI